MLFLRQKWQMRAQWCLLIWRPRCQKKDLHKCGGKCNPRRLTFSAGNRSSLVPCDEDWQEEVSIHVSMSMLELSWSQCGGACGTWTIYVDRKWRSDREAYRTGHGVVVVSIFFQFVTLSATPEPEVELKPQTLIDISCLVFFRKEGSGRKRGQYNMAFFSCTLFCLCFWFGFCQYQFSWRRSRTYFPQICPAYRPLVQSALGSSGDCAKDAFTQIPEEAYEVGVWRREELIDR